MMQRTLPILVGALAIAFHASAASPASAAEDRPPGITEPEVLPPFDPDALPCSPPPGSRRVLAFARDNDRDFMRGVDFGLAAAAGDRGLDYRSSVADNDASRMIEQVEAYRESRVGALVAAPVDPPSLAPHLQELIWSGSYVGTIVPPPATTILNAPQYLTGKALGDAAADYIVSKLGGEAKGRCPHPRQPRIPRAPLHRDARRLAGSAGRDDRGRHFSRHRRQRGRLRHDEHHPPRRPRRRCRARRRYGRARRAGCRARRRQGPPRPVLWRHRRRAGSGGRAAASRAAPTRPASASPRPSSAMRWASTPPTGSKARASRRRMDILPIALNAENLAAYEADVADPGAVYADPARRAMYLQDVRKRLLRHQGPLPEFPLVVGAQVALQPARAALFTRRPARRRTGPRSHPGVAQVMHAEVRPMRRRGPMAEGEKADAFHRHAFSAANGNFTSIVVGAGVRCSG